MITQHITRPILETQIREIEIKQSQRLISSVKALASAFL